MVITRVQALAIALGLALVGVAAARSDLGLSRGDREGMSSQTGKTIPTALDVQRDSVANVLAIKPRL